MQDLAFTTRNSIQDSTEKRNSELFHCPEPLKLNPLALQIIKSAPIFIQNLPAFKYFFLTFGQMVKY
jgi:hypothetical protein